MLSYIEISRDNILHNLSVLKTLLSTSTEVAAVIKGNAYGHGQNEIASILEEHVDYFQLDDYLEYKALRQQTKKAVLLLGYLAKEDLSNKLTNCVIGIYDSNKFTQLNPKNKNVEVHLKIDAYLGRQGILPNDIKRFCADVPEKYKKQVSGVYSHFSNIEDTTDSSHAIKQLETFNKVVSVLKKLGYKDLKRHMSATSGILLSEMYGSEFDIARLGIGLYGMWPSEELKTRFNGDTNLVLKPALRWVSHIAQVKKLPKGFPIGYGLTYVTSKPTNIAIVPQGYSDGYDRGLSNIGEVLIKGKRCRVLGRIAMNMFAVDVSSVSNVKQEDEVVLLGTQKKEAISAEEIAAKISTINYEITTRISPLLPRKIVDKFE